MNLLVSSRFPCLEIFFAVSRCSDSEIEFDRKIRLLSKRKSAIPSLPRFLPSRITDNRVLPALDGRRRARVGSGRKIWTKERERKGKEETRGRRERYRVLNVSNSIIPNAQRKVANSIRGPSLPLEYHPFDFANNVFVSSPLSDFSPPRPEEEPGRSILKYRDTLNIVSPSLPLPP